MSSKDTTIKGEEGAKPVIWLYSSGTSCIPVMVTRKSRRAKLKCKYSWFTVAYSTNGWRNGCLHCGALCR